ncbi:MAG: hypothetical protein QN162_15335 [Armatimonadota bacterium]|nr:hypothetical protein [Armatimonadota bacterium]
MAMAFNLWSGLGEAGTRALRGFLELRRQRQAEEQAARQQALALALRLMEADEEVRPALQRMVEQAFPNIRFTTPFPTRLKPLGERKTRDVLANRPDLLAQVPTELHDQPWAYTLQVRPDLGRALYGVDPEAKAAQERAQALQDIEFWVRRYPGRPLSGDLLARAKAAGVPIPTRTEEIRQAVVRPAPTGRDLRGVPLAVDPRTGRAAEPQRVTRVVGTREVEDLPVPADFEVTLPNGQRVAFSSLPPAAQTEIVRQMYRSAREVEVVLPDGRSYRVTPEVAYQQALIDQRRGEDRRYTITLLGGTKMEGLTADQVIRLYEGQQNRALQRELAAQRAALQRERLQQETDTGLDVIPGPGRYRPVRPKTKGGISRYLDTQTGAVLTLAEVTRRAREGDPDAARALGIAPGESAVARQLKALERRLMVLTQARTRLRAQARRGLFGGPPRVDPNATTLVDGRQMTLAEIEDEMRLVGRELGDLRRHGGAASAPVERTYKTKTQGALTATQVRELIRRAVTAGWTRPQIREALINEGIPPEHFGF